MVVCVGFLFFLSVYLVSQIEFSNQGFCEVLEIDFQTLLNICLQDGYNATGQIGIPRDLNYQDFVCLLRYCRKARTYLYVMTVSTQNIHCSKEQECTPKQEAYSTGNRY